MRGVVTDVQMHPYVPRGRILFVNTSHFDPKRWRRFLEHGYIAHHDEIIVLVPPGEPLLLDEAMKLIGELIEI